MNQIHCAGGGRVRTIAAALLCLLFLAPACFADPRVFTDKKGREIIAEIVSAKGDTVVLEKDGRNFETTIDVFSADDQAFIRKWMQDHPPEVDYHFDISVEKKKLEGDTTGTGYYRRKRGKYAYHITVKNRSRETVSGLTVKYRAFMIDRVTGDYYSYSGKAETVEKKGSVKLPALKLNIAAEFDTESFEMEETQQYDTTRLVKDEFIGILVRIVDAKGNVVADFREGGSDFKNTTWEDEKDDGTVTLKPIGS